MEKLRELRESKRVTQQRMAIDLNISQTSISKYEMGTAEPDIEFIVRLAQYFGVSTDYLLGNSDKKYSMSRNELSDDETELILDYRRMDSIQKAELKVYLKDTLT